MDIIATVGPSLLTWTRIDSLIAEGVTIFRVNGAHTDAHMVASIVEGAALRRRPCPNLARRSSKGEQARRMTVLAFGREEDVWCLGPARGEETERTADISAYSVTSSRSTGSANTGRAVELSKASRMRMTISTLSTGCCPIAVSAASTNPCAPS
jgi:hypothetical protein